jgi:hypothetical protein
MRNITRTLALLATFAMLVFGIAHAGGTEARASEAEAASVAAVCRLADAAQLDSVALPLQAVSCDTLCKSLASMKRSADKLCEIAGEDSDRCRAAREKVSNAERKVCEAKCKSCCSDVPVASEEDE